MGGRRADAALRAEHLGPRRRRASRWPRPTPSGSTASRTFTDPFKDYTDAGWQPAHGLYALSSGGWFGQGIGASTQKWGDLPEAHTDFIFAVLGEELGLVGTLLVVGLFFTIAYAAVRVALNTQDPFVRYATFGIVVWLLGQMMINVGMVLAVLPVIGIPLPIVSYGGSALLPSLVALGLVIGFARREPEAAAALAARRRNRSAGLSAVHPPLDSAPMRVLLAGGGSAGHTSPLLATADALRRLDPATEITCLGTREGLEARLVPEAGLPLEFVPRVPLPRRPGADLLRTPTRLRAARAAALEVVDRVRPDVVVGFGGYVSVPAYLAARKRGVPIVVHEGNTVPGIANKLGARMTHHVATSFPGTDLPHAVCTGLPIRRLDLHPRPGRAPRRGAGRPSACATTCPTLLVTGGSQGAARINAAVSGAAADLAAAGVQVLHVVGPEARARRRRRGDVPYVVVQLRRPDGPRLRRRRRGAVPRRQQHRHRGLRRGPARDLRPAPDRQRRAGAQRAPGRRRRRRAAGRRRAR